MIQWETCIIKKRKVSLQSVHLIVMIEAMQSITVVGSLWTDRIIIYFIPEIKIAKKIHPTTDHKTQWYIKPSHNQKIIYKSLKCEYLVGASKMFCSFFKNVLFLLQNFRDVIQLYWKIRTVDTLPEYVFIESHLQKLQ